MKGIYIAAVDKNNPLEKGVINKIYGQINAFKNLNIEIDSAHMEDGHVCINTKKQDYKVSKPSNFFFHRYLRKAYGDELCKYDFAYIRFSRGDFEYYKLIKYLSSNNVKVIVEIPTYPYRQQFEYKDIKNQIYNFFDWIIWKIIRSYVYRISTTNDFDYIEKIKCVKISNGIDLDKIKMVKGNNTDDVIKLVGVANISKWHGYDRVIKGLADYYKNHDNNRKVEFYIIGEGREKKNLEDLTEKLDLKDKVFFLGVKSGEELDNEMDNMHIGVSSLALHRAGGGHDPIKSKEFLGRGLPILLAYDDKLIDMSLEYVFLAEESESAIDISEIVKRYECINSSGSDIRNYACEHLSWNKQMIKVINEL